MAARNRGPGEIVMVSSVTAGLLSLLNAILADAPRVSGRIPVGVRQLLGRGTPRGLQGLSAESLRMLLQLWIVVLVGTELGGRIGHDAHAPTCCVHRFFHSPRGRMSKSLLPRAARPNQCGQNPDCQTRSNQIHMDVCPYAKCSQRK